MNEETLFHEVRQQPAGERRRFLEEACGGDLELQRRIEVLLEADDNPDSLLELKPPANVSPTIGQGLAEGPGTQIGPYKLKEQIGEGGFGLVFVAEQQEPVKRKVALKVIKPGMDTREVVARFNAERQALALMDHPNIARVLDAGATDSGRPYFVMELVRGIPITDYCDQNQLAPRDRLDLFITVCQAVQHAHQKGIIHRDIKPSNVLVTSHDGKPVAKVIDFGVAKAINQQLTERSIYTQFAQMIGTPLYMSPEQAEMSGLDIDTRSDIYSLGVLLYELLTGTTPFDKKRFAKAAYDEIRRLIREEEPPKPSTRVSTSDSIASIAAQRHTEPAKLSNLIRGDLDWITMKALEKDRTRRYETANGLASDIERFLSDEPVEACPPSATYRLRKFARKNRAALTTAAAIALLLVAGVAVSTWQAVRATQAEAAARDAQQAEADRAEGERLAKLDAQAQTAKAEQAAAKEKAANAQAQKRLTQIEKANDILGSIFENLDPKEIAKGERPLQAILVEKLDKAVAQLEGESIGDPLIVAAMQNNFGVSLLGLGEPGKAIVLLEKARATRQAKLGPEHPGTLLSMNNLASAYREAGKLDLALPLCEETLKLRKAKLGPEHPDTLQSMNNLASAYQDAGKLDLALPLVEETLKLAKAKLGPEHPETLISMNNLGRAYRAAGRLDLALPLFEETLKLVKAKLGPEHPDTLLSMGNLALAYRDAGKLDLALPLFEETLKLKKAKLGPEHPDTLISMNNLAMAYRDAGKLDLALPLIEETLKLRKAKLGPEHPETLISMGNLAIAYQAAGKLDLALPLYEETLKLRKAKLGPDHPDTLKTMNNLAEAYRRAGRYAEAEPLSREALAIRLKKLPAEIPANDWQRLHERGELYARGGQWQKAAADYAAAIKAHPEDHALWYQAAPIWLEAGDQDAYRRHCQEMLRRFGETDDPTIAERTAKICLLIPVASADLPPRVRLAERAVTGTEEHKYYRYFLLARALAHYRAEEFDRAIALLDKSLAPGAKVFDPKPAYLVLAMAHHQLGQREEAEQILNKARAMMEEREFPKEDSGDYGSHWHDWVICQLLRREAETLLRGAAEKGSTISTH